VNGRRRRSTPATTIFIALILVAFGVEVLGLPLFQWFANYGPLVRRGEVWRLLTSMFLHAGALHLVVNLIALVQLGRYYELMFGTRRFTIIYFATGIVASVASASWNDVPSVGASGAIFGILGAMIFSIRRSPRWRNDPFGRSIVTQGVFLIILNLVITWTVPQIDKAGHVGGLVAGLILGFILPQPTPPPPPPAQVVIDVAPQDQ
jgi:rhomboid protease GluP